MVDRKPSGGGLVEREQPVAVVLVLLAAGLQLGGKADREVVYERVERVQDRDDPLLLFEWRQRQPDSLQDVGVELRLAACADQCMRLGFS